LIVARGAEIVVVPTASERDQTCEEIARNTGAIFIPPGENEDVILGHGTVIYEFQQQMKSTYNTVLDIILVPVSCGAFLSGSAIACLNSPTRVFGAEPATANQCARILNRRQWSFLAPVPTTIADGVRGGVTELAYSIIQRHVERIFTVTDEQIAEAMKIVYQTLKLAIEPSAAVGVAVLLFNDEFRDICREHAVKIGIVLEGGNVDVSSAEKMMPWLYMNTVANT